MAPSAQLPILPHGSPSILSGLSETFSFHSSPEAFITSRVLALQHSLPDLAKSRVPIRARVLNRNVAIISAYDHIRQILCEPENEPKASVGEAYEELMAPFFPPPNLLLSDPPHHGPYKERWATRFSELPERSRHFVRETAAYHFGRTATGSTIDLYDCMKDLSWKLILGIFINATKSDSLSQEAAEIQSLQDDLLRGQFSLFPLSVNTMLWKSPRARGLAATKKLLSLLKLYQDGNAKVCPFAVVGHDIRELDDNNDLAHHLILFTSSLAVKSLASFLTALFLNVFLLKNEVDFGEYMSIATRITRSNDRKSNESILKSVLLETERLSPPVVGIMRRAVQDVTLKSIKADAPNTLIPKGWDVWLYFVGAARDPNTFESLPENFHPPRYQEEKWGGADPEGLAFGAGNKRCLGKELMRDVAMTVLETCLGSDGEDGNGNGKVSIEGDMNAIPDGVQGWLGWKSGIKPEDWARDMKQLPTQRPSKPLKVTLLHSLAM